MSKNSDYEKRQKAKGLKKVTVWVPDTCEVEFKLVASYCVDNREYYPDMVRSNKTGQLRKAT